MLERAASGLSHEINQVLTYAIGYAELIAERIPETLREETREDLEALLFHLTGDITTVHKHGPSTRLHRNSSRARSVFGHPSK